MLVPPIRAMNIAELIAELGQYPSGMGIYIGKNPNEALSKENLIITRREPHLGDPAILHIATAPKRR